LFSDLRISIAAQRFTNNKDGSFTSAAPALLAAPSAGFQGLQAI